MKLTAGTSKISGEENGRRGGSQTSERRDDHRFPYIVMSVTPWGCKKIGYLKNALASL